MWYKYVDRVGYDAVRVWRYQFLHLGELTLNSIKMITVCWKQNIQDGSVSISLELLDQKDL